MFDDGILACAGRLIEACRQRSKRLITAESCTGGLVAAAVTAVPGSSAVFDRGYLVYSYEAKTAMLGVAPALIAEHGAVSEEVARAMAAGIGARHPSCLGVAVTGVAGPGSDSQAKPAGLVHFAAVCDGGIVTAVRRYGDVGRPAVRLASVGDALALAETCLAPEP